MKSNEYELLWLSITRHAKTEPSPTLHYFITNYTLNDLLQKMYPAADKNNTQTAPSLSKDEEAALSYIGGYLVRAVTKKVKKGPKGSNKMGY